MRVLLTGGTGFVGSWTARAVVDAGHQVRYLVRDAYESGLNLPGPYGQYEIPLLIQDRSFNADGSLFYPTSRTFFDGFAGPYLPTPDISPIWNPEFFGNTMMVNGNTWPFLNVEQRRYRFRFLNACNARTLLLTLDRSGLPFWQIGADGGFLRRPSAPTSSWTSRACRPARPSRS